MKKMEITGKMQELPVGQNSLLQNLMQRADIDGLVKSRQETLSQNWDQLEGIYMSVAESIRDMGCGIQSVSEIVARLGVKESAEFVSTVKSAMRDLGDFTERLVRNHVQHSSRTGVVTSAEDLSLCMQIFNEYVLIGDQLKVVMFPTLLQLHEFHSEALSNIKLDDDSNLSDVQNPQVVTDVEFKESTAG